MWEGGRYGHVSSRSTKLHSLDSASVPQFALHLILQKCLTCARVPEFDDPRKVYALETFSVAARCILAKNLEGWEVMTAFAGEAEKGDSLGSIPRLSTFDLSTLS